MQIRSSIMNCDLREFDPIMNQYVRYTVLVRCKLYQLGTWQASRHVPDCQYVPGRLAAAVPGGYLVSSTVVKG